MGLGPRKNHFIKGLIVMRQLASSTWREKTDHYKRWGWSEHQVLDALRKHPRIMATSTDKSTNIMNLFTSKVACGLSILLRRPHIFSLSSEKTIPSAPKFFLLQLHRLSSSSANAPKHIPENSNWESLSAIYPNNRHGFSRKRVSKYPKFRPPKGPDSVIASLKKHGFNDSRISVIVRKWPLIFQYVPEICFSPKITTFRSLGFSSLDIVKILTLAPTLLGRIMDQIMPCVYFLKSFLRSDKDFISSIVRSPRILEANLQETLLPNVGILREVGVPESHIAEFLKISPYAISIDPKTFRSAVEEVQKLNFDPKKKSFVVGVIVIREISIPIWKEKVEVYKRWGWSDDQLIDAFRRNPRMMAASKDKINKIHHLLINKTGCDISLLVTRPNILMFGCEKTIAPRCAYYQALSTKGLIREGFDLSHMLTCPKWWFLRRYVWPNVKRNPELFKLYQQLFPNTKE